MEDEIKLAICPQCGSLDADGKSICPFCRHATLQTDMSLYGEFWNVFFEIKGVQLERTKQTLYRKYVYSSPEFDEVLFNKRQAEDDEFNDEIAIKDKERAEKLNNPHCPKCKSTAITAGQRGFNIITGFIGSNQTMNRCSNCGYKWKP